MKYKLLLEEARTCSIHKDIHGKDIITSDQNPLAESISRSFNIKPYAQAIISDLKGKKSYIK